MKQKLKNILQRKFNSPIAKKLVNGIAWNVTGTALSKLILMIASILTARILGVDRNGEYSVIISTVLIFSTFSGLGLGVTATRFISEYKNTDKKKCSRIIGMTNIMGLGSSFFMAILLVLVAPWLAREQLNAQHLSFGLMLASVMVVINTINTIQISTLSGFEDFKVMAKLSIIQAIITFPVNIIFVYYLNVIGLIWANIVVSSIMIILYGLENHKMRKEHDICIDIRGVSKETTILWNFSLPSMLSSVMVGLAIWVGNTFITATANGYFELGIFNAANQWRTILTFLPSAVGGVILPLIISNKGNDSLDRINMLFGWVIVNCFIIPILAVPELIAWLYGGNYSGHTLNVSLLLIALTCSFLSFVDGIARNLVRNNLMWLGFLNNLFWGAIFLGLIWYLRSWGSIGITMSYLIAYLAVTIVFIPVYIKAEVAHERLLISKEIVFMWGALLIQLIGTLLTQNPIIRMVTLILAVLALWQVFKLMLGKSKVV